MSSTEGYNLYIAGQTPSWSSTLIEMSQMESVIFSQFMALKPMTFKHYHHLNLVLCKMDFGGNLAHFIVELNSVSKTFRIIVLYKPDSRKYAEDMYNTFTHTSKYLDVKAKMLARTA